MPMSPQEQPFYSSYVPRVHPRKVGLLLGLGIFVLPYIFGWFTLRNGHTKTARTVSFVWLGILVLSMSIRSGDSNLATTLTANPPTVVPRIDPKEAALSQITLDVKWSKGGFDNVMLADFTILNPSAYAVKDLEVTCTHFANSGTQIDSNTRTIYEVVPAKGKKILRDSQATKTSCKVTDLEISS
jgi:hypothetical protein